MKTLQNQVIGENIVQLYKLIAMYSQYSGHSSNYNDYLASSSRLKTTNLNKYDSYSYLPTTNKYQSSSWNIEESKENIAQKIQRPQTSAHLPYSKTELSSFQNDENCIKKEWQQSMPTLTKSKNTKSSKTIKFSIETDIQSSLHKGYSRTADSDFKSLRKKDNLKSITMSLDYKSSLKDLLPNFKIEDYKQKDFDRPAKTFQSCKSQMKIRLDCDQKFEKTAKQIPKSPTQLIKSYKKIAEYMNEGTFSKKEEKQIPIFNSSNKSSKYIREQLTRPKAEKTVSYNEHLNDEKSCSKTKKHNTVDGSKFTFCRDILSKGKLSIHDFQLGQCKGQGAFGQVFPAIHKATKMLVAIKKVPKQKVKYMLDQFINEIKIQMFFDHPNIVKLYGFFDDSTNFYIIMEYMQGGNLFNLIKKKKKIPEAQAIERLKDICIGIKEMHDNSVLHRDIKPENIVITNDVCKLCDLGWAAICKDRRNTYCGTLDYVSPQIIGGEGYDDSVDIWCIGVLAYEMICGKTPFYNISRKETMKKIVDVNYEYPPELTSSSKAFIDRILKKNPDDRIGIDQVLKHKFLL